MFPNHEEVEPFTEMNEAVSELYENADTFDAKRKQALLELLQQLATDDCGLKNYDWSTISNKFLAAEIPQHPRQIQNSEMQLDKIIEEYHRLLPQNTPALFMISYNLFQLGAAKITKTDHKLLHDVILLEKIITRRRLLNSFFYRDSMGALENFRQKYKLSMMDRIIRYAIGFNTGLNNGSSLFDIMTTLFFTPPVMVVSGIISLTLSLTIAHFFSNSYKDEDRQLLWMLNNYEKKIHTQVYEESMLRLQCYKLMMQKIVLLKQCHRENIGMIRDQRKLKALIHTMKNNNPILELDLFINKKLEIYQDITPPQAEDKPVDEDNSIYIRAFRSKYWGPFLNFLSAAGTSFGVAKAILLIAGVTAIMGSSLMLFGIVTAASVVISTLFALKHLKFNLIAAEKKDYLKTFKEEIIDGTEIKIGQMERFKQDLSNDLVYMHNIIQQRSLRSVSVNTLSVPGSMATLSLPNSATILAAQYGMFRESSEPGIGSSDAQHESHSALAYR